MATYDFNTGFFYDEPPPPPPPDEIYSPMEEFQQYVDRWFPYPDSSQEYPQSEVDSTPVFDPQTWESTLLSPSYAAAFFSQAVADLNYNCDEHTPVAEKQIDFYKRELSVDEGSCSGDVSIADGELPDLEGKAYGSQDYL
jgi:hypothetical protein